MPIDKLVVRNFKGIAERQEFDIKPITLFIGPNSSGKSSCIHALAALAQTVKLANSKLPIVLDDEYAQVHLGRFIEVIHSKLYTDSFDIGIALNKVGGSIRFGKELELVGKNDRLDVSYTFKSTKRTQDTFLEKAAIKIGSSSLMYQIKPKEPVYRVQLAGKEVKAAVSSRGGLRFEFRPIESKLDEESNKTFFHAFILNESVSDIVASELRRTLYLGPFRQSPLRRYPTRGAAPFEVGPQGESAITLMANEYVQSRTRLHINQVSKWISMLGLAKQVEISRVGKSDLFSVNATLADGVSLPIADLGYGVSQVLPVLAQCSFARTGSTLLFEQPELHLHPAAASKLATVFAEAVKQKDLRIVAETHSRELFAQLFTELREGRISVDDISAYEVLRSDGKSTFKKIQIEKDGDHYEVYDPWHKGICEY